MWKVFFYKFLQTEISCKFLLHNYNLSFVTAVQFLLLYHDLPFLLFLFVSNVGVQTESWCKNASGEALGSPIQKETGLLLGNS